MHVTAAKRFTALHAVAWLASSAAVMLAPLRAHAQVPSADGLYATVHTNQ